MEVVMPKVGLTMSEGTIVQWHKREGEYVHKGEPLFTFETEKSTLEHESPGSGVLRRILVPAGQTAACLTPVALLEDGEPHATFAAGEAAPAPTLARRLASPRARWRARSLGIDINRVQASGSSGVIRERDVLAAAAALTQITAPSPRATPLAQKRAAELGIDLATVRGSGPEGKITRDDVERVAAQRRAPETPSTHATPSEPVSPVRRAIAQRLTEAARDIPTVTLMTEADATAFVEAREQLSAELGEKVSYNTLLMIICARALREHPQLNASWVEAPGGEPRIVRHADIHIGLAVDTPRGLLVPVLRDVPARTLREVHQTLSALVARAREGALPPDDLRGSTFTITNLGMFEVDGFTPLLNPPEAAILGVGRIVKRAVPLSDERIVARSMMTLSLTFDHRVVDGAPAAAFLQRVRRLIERPFALMV